MTVRELKEKLSRLEEDTRIFVYNGHGELSLADRVTIGTTGDFPFIFDAGDKEELAVIQ